MLLLILSFILVFVLIFIFFMSGKFMNWSISSKSVFECGFSSYFMSRFSFPIHYFLVALTFLFLDLELVFLMPFFMEETTNFKGLNFFFFFSFNLTFALLWEWKIGLLDWKI